MTFRKQMRWTFVALALAAGVCLHAQEPEGLKKESGDLAEKQAWFRSGRTVKGENSGDLLQRGYDQKLRLRQLRTAQEAAQRGASRGRAAMRFQDLRVSPTFSYLQWQNMGPLPMISDVTGSQDYGLTTGRITAIVVDPSDSSGNTVYVGSAFGGVWKSTNAASTLTSDVIFTPIFEGQPTLAIGAIGLQPNGSVILVGTGEANSAADSYYSLGIFRSTDGGQNWTQITSAENGARPFRGLSFSDFAFSGANNNLVVATAASSAVGIDTGGETQGGEGRGIYYSNDAGQTWSKASAYDSGNLVDAGSTSAVIYYPATGKFYTVIRFHGVYSSTDGATWTRLASQPDASITSVSCPNTPVSFNCPIYRGSMTIANGELFLAYVDTVNLDVNGEPSLHILRLNQSGGVETGWTAATTSTIVSCGDNGGGCGAAQGTYNLILKAVPRSATTADLFFGAVNLFKSGSVQKSAPTLSLSWQNLTHVYGCSTQTSPDYADTAHIHPDQHAMDFAVPPLSSTFVAYFGNDGGVSRTLNGAGLTISSCTGGTNPFQELNSRLGALGQFIGFTNHPAVGGSVLGGTQDNGTLLLDPNNAGSNGSTFRGVDIGDGGHIVIDPSDTTRIFDSIASSSGPTINKCISGLSCNAGSFGTYISAANLGGDAMAFYPYFILDPQKPASMLIGTCRIHRANVAGNLATATPISFNFTTGDATVCTGGTSSGHAKVRAIAAGGPAGATGNSLVIYAGTFNTDQAASGHVFVTTNSDGGAGTWVDRTGNINPSAYDISSIVMSPHDSTGATAYLAIMGFNPKGVHAGHIWKTTDFGATWTDKTADLPDVPVDSLAWDPFSPNIIYAGTDVGVFVTTDDGASWSEFGNGLPNVAVTELKVYNANGLKKLRASTYGRGIWQIDLPQLNLTFSANRLDLSTILGNTTKRTISLTNSGADAVTLSGISVSSGYSQTNDCPGTLTANASCNITVSFKPTGVGPKPGTLTISDSAAGSPHTVALDGAGVDFTIALSRPVRPAGNGGGGAVAVRGTQEFQVVLRVDGAGAASTGPMDFGLDCVGLPRGATCDIAPAQVSLGANEVPVRITVRTTPPGARRLGRANATPKGSHPWTLRARSAIGERSIGLVLDVR